MLTQKNNHEWVMTVESCPLHSMKTPHCMLGAHLYSRLSSEPSGGAKSAPHIYKPSDSLKLLHDGSGSEDGTG